MAWAHYNGTRWHVTRLRHDIKPGQSPDDWINLWQPQPTEINPKEKEAIARIAMDTAFVLDVAASLAERALDYSAFNEALAARAQASGDPQQIQGMEAEVNPWKYMLPGLFRYPTVYRLSTLAPVLYRALAGKAQHDSTGIQAVRDITATPIPVTDTMRPLPIKEAMICPPYEQIDLGRRPN